ncbi:hypothetical protein vseg_013103 [Gypsophila vaccaria]
MHRPKKRTSPKKYLDWFKFLDDCRVPGQAVIPVGSRFQAVLPERKDPSDGASSSDNSDTLRLLGTVVWARQDDDAAPTEEDPIGNGRPDSCACSSPGSVQCVKIHVSEARKRLRSELGPAFEIWKFDEMGEDVGKSWSSKQKVKFGHLVKTNPLSAGKSFLKPAQMSFPSKTRKDIVSYYLNVHVPKRIAMLTRSDCQTLDSDDDEVEAAASTSAKSSSRSSQSSPTTEHVKSHYLTGRR